MLHIILLILKIIGIIILVILGLLLLILLTVLLVPVRYRANVSHGEVLDADARISWLLHIVGARISYVEGKLHIRLRILWIILYDNLLPKKEKVKKKREKVSVKKKKARTKVSRKEVIKTVKNGKVKQRITENSISTEKLSIKDKKQESKLEIKKEITDKPSVTKVEVKVEDKDNTVTKKDIIIGIPEGNHSTETRDSQETEDNNSLFEKIINKIKNIKLKILALFRGIKSKIIKWFESFANMKQKVNLILEFVRDEYNKEGFSIVFTSLKKLLKHILPTKLRSRLVFGTGDPCSTGQALGVISILYSFYGDKIVVIPDFEKKRFEGEHYARGRIRLVTVLIIVIKLILDKRFKQLKSNFQILKEAL